MPYGKFFPRNPQKTEFLKCLYSDRIVFMIVYQISFKNSPDILFKDYRKMNKDLLKKNTFKDSQRELLYLKGNKDLKTKLL